MKIVASERLDNQYRWGRPQLLHREGAPETKLSRLTSVDETNEAGSRLNSGAEKYDSSMNDLAQSQPRADMR